MGPIGIAAGPSTGPWKKGQSGNPRGKQRGTTHLAQKMREHIRSWLAKKDRNGRRRFDRVLERLYDIITAEGGSQNQVNAAALLLAHACGKPVAPHRSRLPGDAPRLPPRSSAPHCSPGSRQCRHCNNRRRQSSANSLSLLRTPPHRDRARPRVRLSSPCSQCWRLSNTYRPKRRKSQNRSR